MAEHQTQTVYLQTADGDNIGISPVLLQAVNQTLDSGGEHVSVMVADSSETVIHDDSDLATSQTVIIGSNEETVNSGCSDEDQSSLMATTTPNKNPDGHLVIKVVGSNFGDLASQDAIMKLLRQKLTIKVVLQLENNDGEIVFEGIVTPNSGREVIDDSSLDFGDESAMGDKENKEVNDIVKNVVNTIKELSLSVGKMDIKPCPICGDVVTGYHYAVQTCESCKGFFKRTVQNKKTHTCHRGGTCDITLGNRKKCAACRFQKCCDVGMKIEGVRDDRSRGGRSKYYGATINFPAKRPSTVESPPQQPDYSKRMKLPDLPYRPTSGYPQPIIPQIMQELVNMEVHYEQNDNNPMACCIDKLTDCDRHKFSSMLHLTDHRLHQIVRWARFLPDFLSIDLDDQMLLLQNSWAELVSLGAIWRSRFSSNVILLSFGKSIDLEKAREMEHEEVITRMLHVCTNFRRLNVDKYEYVTLKVLALMLPDIKGLGNVNKIQQYQNRLLDALLLYTSTHHPYSPTKFGELLLRLSEVQRLTAISRSQMQHCAHIDRECILLRELIQACAHSTQAASPDQQEQPTAASIPHLTHSTIIV